jgi:hypothetical protein
MTEFLLGMALGAAVVARFAYKRGEADMSDRLYGRRRKWWE